MLQDVVEEACGPDRDPWLCRWVADVTDNKTAANVAEWLSPWLLSLLIILAAVIVNRLVRRIVRRAVTRWEHAGQLTIRGRNIRLIPEATRPTPTARRHQRAQTIGRGLASLATIVVAIVTIALILSVFGVSASALLTSAGLIGVALSFGAQNLLRDLIAGTFMIFEDQLGFGDVVDLGVASGTVEDVSLRTTRLRDAEGVVWHVPNGVIQRVGNRSQQWSRAVVDVPVAYTADIERAQQVIRETAQAFADDEQWKPRLLGAPELLGVESFTLDTVTLRVSVKTQPGEQWRVGRELRARIKRALDAAGIQSAPPSPAG